MNNIANNKRFSNPESSIFNVECSMSKHPYAAPYTEIVLLDEQPLMVKASPGVGSEWNGDPIDAKDFCLDYLPSNFSDPWGD